MDWLLDNFNTREVATGIWLVVGISFLLFWKKTRVSLKEVFRAILQRKLLVVFGSLAAYLTGLCWLLSELSLWNAGQITSTILWYFLSGAVLLGRSLSAKEDDRYFKKLILDSFKVATVFEFIVVAYTFHFLIELLLVPFFAFLSIIIGVSETKEEYRPAKKLFEAIIAIIVIVLLWNSVSQIWQSPDIFFTTKNGYNFILPILLTIGSVPFFYLWYCYASYEMASVRIGSQRNQPDVLKRYARRRFFFSFFFKPWLLQRAVRQFQILSSRTNEEVDQIIESVQRHEMSANNPPAVNESDGWSPYLSRDYLIEHGLRTEDYHVTYGGDEWWASSSYVDLDDHILPNKISFYLIGQEDLVNKLKLVGSFYTDTETNQAIKKFREVALNLTERALGVSAEEAVMIIPDSAQFDIDRGETRISYHIDEYPAHNGFYVNFLLSRGYSAD